jgi:hypothetical protein
MPSTPREKQSPYQIAKKSVIILVCLSLTLGGSLRGVWDNTNASFFVDASGTSPTESPVEEIPFPLESPDSEAHPKEEERTPREFEIASGKHCRVWARPSEVAKLFSCRTYVGVSSLLMRTEQIFLNGCGALLRC